MKAKDIPHIIAWVLLILGSMVSHTCLAQSRVPDGQYSSPVGSNWTDSLLKYDDLSSYLLNKYPNRFFFDADTDKLGVLYQYFVRNLDKYALKVENMEKAKEADKKHKADSIKKHQLETKYHIVLP